MPLIPALGRQRQVDLCEFKISLVYRVSSRIQDYTEKTVIPRFMESPKYQQGD